METRRVCVVNQELERCFLCSGLIEEGDEILARPGTDEDGVHFTALAHILCVDEDDRLGMSENLYAEERWGCLNDIEQAEADSGEKCSPEYRAFREKIEARTPLLNAQELHMALLSRDFHSTLSRAKAAEGQLLMLKERVAQQHAGASGAFDKTGLASVKGARDALAEVLKLMGVHEKATSKGQRKFFREINGRRLYLWKDDGAIQRWIDDKVSRGEWENRRVRNPLKTTRGWVGQWADEENNLLMGRKLEKLLGGHVKFLKLIENLERQ